VLAHTGSRHRAWASALGWLDRPVDRVGCLAYLVVTDADDLTAVQKRLELAVGDGTVLAACGATVLDSAGYRSSFVEADRLLATARIGGSRATGFDDAGVLQVLLATPTPRLRWFVERHLGPVLKRPELLATLRAWLAASGSRQLVSEELHLHRNSVGYRVGKLKALLGVDPLRPDHAAVLHTALAAHDLLHSDATYQDAESRAHHASEEPSG
jgi:DNA-binding PucR family transcriptional regulator